MNLLAVFEMLRRSPQFDAARLSLFFQMLDQHGAHIRRNLEFSYISTSNHYLSDVVGLFLIGTMLPELEEAREWRAFGFREFLSEMDKQVSRMVRILKLRRAIIGSPSNCSFTRSSYPARRHRDSRKSPGTSSGSCSNICGHICGQTDARRSSAILTAGRCCPSFARRRRPCVLSRSARFSLTRRFQAR